MPVRQVCGMPGCNDLSAPGQGRCPRHRRGDQHAYNVARGGSTAQGYGGAWPRIRARYLRDHPTCVVCGRPARVVDHIRPRVRGSALDLTGQDSDANLQAMCVPHHNAKTRRETNARARRV